MARVHTVQTHNLVVNPHNGIIHERKDDGDCERCILLNLSATPDEIRDRVARWEREE